MELLIKYGTVYIASAVRFFLGPTLAATYQIGVLPSILLTILGMMTTVYLFTYFGHRLHALTVRLLFRKQRPVFTPRNRRFVKIWRTYGLKGVAFITPIVLSPILGAFLCNFVGGNRKEI